MVLIWKKSLYHFYRVNIKYYKHLGILNLQTPPNYYTLLFQMTLVFENCDRRSYTSINALTMVFKLTIFLSSNIIVPKNTDC